MNLEEISLRVLTNKPSFKMRLQNYCNKLKELFWFVTTPIWFPLICCYVIFCIWFDLVYTKFKTRNL